MPSDHSFMRIVSVVVGGAPLPYTVRPTATAGLIVPRNGSSATATPPMPLERTP